MMAQRLFDLFVHDHFVRLIHRIDVHVKIIIDDITGGSYQNRRSHQQGKGDDM